MLLETEEYSRERKKENKRNENVVSIYWGIATAIYLAWSFATGRWDFSWILWPVAGVLYGVVVVVLRMLRK